MTSTFSRRQFLRHGAAGGVVVLGGGAWLAACGGSKKASSSGGSLKSINYRLDWIENFEFTGSYLADSRGYYKQEGLDVSFVPSGPTDSIEPQVVSGKDFVATSYSETTAPAILAGASLAIIGSIYQKAPYAIVSRAGNPIHTPQDLYGKVMGVSAASQTTWKAFCQLNGIDAGKIKTVPVQVDPAPLAAGTVDGWLGYIMDEPSTLRSRGVDVDTMLLADFGFNLYEAVYIVTRDALKNHRDEVKAFMRAEIRGWQDSLADPAAGAALTVNKYGKNLGLNTKAQNLAAVAQNQIIVTNDPKRGILTLDPQLFPSTIKTLVANGINITADQLYDTTLLDEVYGGKTTL